MTDSPGDTNTRAAARGLRAVGAIAKYHLQPLVLVELAAFVAALLAGWELIAAAILLVHVARMGLPTLRAHTGNGAGDAAGSARAEAHN